jgi:hypothetical protein
MINRLGLCFPRLGPITVRHNFLSVPRRPARLPYVRQFAVEASSRPLFYRTRLVLRYSAYLIASSVAGVGLLTGAIFVHDAFTYTNKHLDRVPISPPALHLERGGPKNLPIVRAFLDDVEDEENIALTQKPHLVIVGGGWAVRFLAILAVLSC